MRVKRLTLYEGARYNITDYPNFSATGSIIGMKKKYYGKNALLVRCGGYIYNVSDNKEIYDVAK